MLVRNTEKHVDITEAQLDKLTSNYWPNLGMVSTPSLLTVM